MGIFIDTGIFIAARNEKDKSHQGALQILKLIRTKKYGEYYTSDYVFDEATTVAFVRTKSRDKIKDIGQFIQRMPGLKLLFMNEMIFNTSWEICLQYLDKPLSFIDCTNIAWCREKNITYIATVDSHFEGIVKSITPEIFKYDMDE